MTTEDTEGNFKPLPAHTYTHTLKKGKFHTSKNSQRIVEKNSYNFFFNEATEDPKER